MAFDGIAAFDGIMAFDSMVIRLRHGI